MRVLILLLPFFLFAEIIKFNNLKNEYYKNQMIILNGKIILQNDINLTPIPTSNIEVNLSKINPYIYKLKVRFKATNQEHKLILIGDKFYKEINFNNLFKLKQISYPPNFCGIFAKNFKIINPISSSYDKNKNILSFTIKCTQCNIKDFNLSDEQNLTLQSPNEATYFILLPKTKQKLHFYYFDLNTSSFKKISIPIILKEKTISTQTNINPEEQTFFTPLNILLLSVIALFLITFLIYQQIWILIFPLIIGGYLIYQILPKGEIILPKNTKVQILPTPQSTIIYITKKPQKAEILNKEKKYIKIKIDNKVGWVKNENN